ncbi:hypothetical protein FACS1894182_04960 [Bacteroidia bacterium]|nr:hypothetical protein FACS1894182_04960 [Bacteroidia bacterium]
MKKLFFLLTAGLLLNGIQLNAQKAFEKYAVGVDLGLYGPGLTVATNLTPHLYLKAGVNTLGFTYKTTFDIDPDGFLPGSPANTVALSGTVSDPKLNFTNFKAIVDYYPMKNGIFSLSVGLFAGDNSISVSGKIDNYGNSGYVFNPWEDIIVKPNADGTFDGKLKLGNTIKPYFGIGLGRTITTNNRLGFRFELGAVYQGKFKFESKNAVVSSSAINSASDTFFIDSTLFDLLTIYPMLNFTLSYRLN